VQVTLDAYDPGGGNASGIKQTYYSINYSGPDCAPGSINYCSFYTGPVTVSPQGQNTIRYFTEDNAGNFSSESSESVNIDLSSPVTTASLSGLVYSGTTYETAVAITLNASDSGGSGVQGIYYILDGGLPEYTPYAGSAINVSTVSAVGSHTLQYWSANNAGTTGAQNTLSFTIQSPTTTSLTVSPNPSVNGQSVTLTSTVAASISGNTPGGAVTFKNGSTTIGVGSVIGGVATLSTSSLSVGSHSITASYVGTFTFMASTSGEVTDVVLESTTTTLSSNVNSASYGGVVKLTATVTPSISGTPTGNVQFFNGTTSLGIAGLSGGSASLSVSNLAVGDDSIKAVYLGSTTYATSTSSVLTETIDADNTTTTINSSPNPSIYGQKVTFGATVKSAVAGKTPTGTVTFKSGSTTLGTGTLNGSGVADYSTTALPAGTSSITASYNGSADFDASGSAALSQVVNPGDTLTTLSSSLDPAAFGKSVKFEAKVTSLIAGVTPKGSVTFMNGTATLGTETLNSSGEASISTTALPEGTDIITASYNGSADFNASSSADFSEIVTTAASTTKITSSLNPAPYTQAVTFTTTVTSTAGKPSGTVTFMNGTSTLGTGTLNGSGVATFTTSELPVGTYSITASYGGATDFSTSNSAALSQLIETDASTTTIGTSLSKSAYGQAVTFTATVTSPAGRPTGTVTFTSGTTILGTGTLNGSGMATFTTSELAVGTHSITAVYAGATDFSTSKSAAISQVVDADKTTTTLASSLNPSTQGQSVTLTATVTSAIAGTTPAGTVTFKSGILTLGTATLSDGVATLTTSTLLVGTDSIIASYGGATDYSASSSTHLSQVVLPD